MKVRAGTKKRHAGAVQTTLPLILPKREQPKSMPPPYLPLQIDLFFQEFMKSPESTWETFWTPRGPPGGAQKAPRGPPRASKHQTHSKLTSNSQQTHSKLTSNSQQTHIEHTENQTYIQIFYREWNSRYLASGDRMLYDHILSYIIIYDHIWSYMIIYDHI